MRTNLKWFVAIFLTVMTIACSKNDDGMILNEDNSKSVTLCIAGAQSRAVAVPVENETDIALNSITVVFTNGSDIKSIERYESGSAGYSSLTGTGLTFHRLNATINEVIVLGNYDGTITLSTPVATLKNTEVLIQSQQNNNALYLYGDSKINASGPAVEHTEGGDHAANIAEVAVSLKPLVARFEIGNIQCTNLGTDYGSFELEGMGMVSYYGKSVLSNNPSARYMPGVNIFEPITGALPGKTTPEYKMFEDATWNWSWDLLVSPVKISSNTTQFNPEAGKVYAYNFFAPATGSGVFPDFKLKLDKVTSISGLPVAVNYVSTNGFNISGNHPQAGYIYTVDMAFTEEVIKDFYGNDICVVLTVTVEPWKVVAVTPNFL